MYKLFKFFVDYFFAPFERSNVIITKRARGILSNRPLANKVLDKVNEAHRSGKPVVITHDNKTVELSSVSTVL
jgi:hypothetical protein